MTPFAIAGIQMNVSAVHSNIPAMQLKLDILMSIYPWVQMVMFSELCAFGPLTANAQELPGPAEQSFQAMAAKHKIWLIPGSIYERVGDKIYNTSSVIDPTGQVVGRYRKMFPFLPYEEGVSPGEDFLLFDVPNAGRFGLSICYDSWFPETSRTLTVRGAEILLIPSLTPSIDRDIELSIARANAALNQCYIFNINGLQAGGVGRSIVCEPRGSVVHQSYSGEEYIPVEVDFERVRRGRESGLLGLGQMLKSFRDRKVDFNIYRSDTDLAYLNSLGQLTKPQRPKIETDL